MAWRLVPEARWDDAGGAGEAASTVAGGRKSRPDEWPLALLRRRVL